MMSRSNEIRRAPAIVAALALIPFLVGIVEGRRQDWSRMSFYLFGSVVMIFFATTGFTILKADACFKRVEDQFREKQVELPKANPFVAWGLSVFVIVSVAISMSLGLPALLRQDALSLGVCLTVCAISIGIWWGAIVALATSFRCRRLEVFISARQGTSDRDPRESGSSQ